MTKGVHSVRDNEYQLAKLLKKYTAGWINYLPPIFEKRQEVLFLGSVAVSAVSAISTVSADVLLYILVAIKASFLKLGMCNICKNSIAKMFLDFF